MASNKIPKNWVIPDCEQDFIFCESHVQTMNLLQAIKSKDVDKMIAHIELLSSAANRLQKSKIGELILNLHE